MSQPAEELHKRNLDILAKLASSNNPDSEGKENILCEVKNKLNVANHSINGKLSIHNENENLCTQNDSGMSNDKENILHCHLEVGTPRKRVSSAEPVTPTTNLKMLVSAASDMRPALAEVSVEKRTLFMGNCQGNEIEDPTKAKLKRGELMGRKEKSLGLLCKKFLSIYPEYPSVGVTVMLDDVVNSLSIGRRRVYDIVNVLESMEMMVRQAKNKYIWFGKSRLTATLSKLKALALHVYGRNFSHMLKRFCGTFEKPKVGQSKGLNVLKAGEANISHALPTEFGDREAVLKNQPKVDDLTSSIMDSIISFDFASRDSSKSLGILCQKFIMLFMVAEDSIVSLDRAAKLLITEPEEGPGKYKTKIRRLYDIANILTSLNFLKKCVSYEDATKKAAYKWIGLDLNAIDIGEDASKAFLSQEYSLTRHSLLTQAPRSLYQSTKSSNVASMSKQRKLQCRSSSANQLSLDICSKSLSEYEPNQVRVLSVRAFSDTMVTHGSNMGMQNSDGFDIENYEEEIEIESTIDDSTGKEFEEKSGPVSTEADSPNQARFKEKLRDLQQEFPDKLSSNGLLELLLACNENQVTIPHTSRRRLSSDFDTHAFPDPKKVKIVDCMAILSSSESIVNGMPQNIENCVTHCTPMCQIKSSFSVATCNNSLPVVTFTPAPVNKPLLLNSGIDARNLKCDVNVLDNSDGTTRENVKWNRTISKMCSQKTDVNVENKSETNDQYHFNSSDLGSVETKTESNLPTYFTIPATLKSVQVLPGVAQNITTVLLSPMTHPASVPEDSLYKIIPGLLQPVNLPIPQSSGENKNSKMKCVVPIMMRPPVGTVTSSYATHKPSTSKPVDSVSHHFSANLAPELLTPPHVLYRALNKPAANPIIFPKMTPETPSSNSQISQSALTSATRKLLHKDTD